MQQQPALFLNQQQISFRPHKEFLGLILEEKLNWKIPITALKQKCNKRLDILRCISPSAWGADRTTMFRIYRAVIRSKLDYGCTLDSSAKEHILKILDPVHNAAIRLATGAFKSSPVQSLYAESGEPPLRIRREQLML